MKLRLTSSTTLPVVDSGEGTLPQIRLSAMQPHSKPIHPERKRAFLEGGITNGDVQIVSEKRSTSALGWPVSIIEAKVVRGNEVVEERLVYIYDMLQWSGAAMLRSATGQMSAVRADHEPALASVQVDTSDDIVMLEDLLA